MLLWEPEVEFQHSISDINHEKKEQCIIFLGDEKMAKARPTWTAVCVQILLCLCVYLNAFKYQCR